MKSEDFRESLNHNRRNKRRIFQSHQMVLTWEHVLDIGRLDEGFPVIGEMPKVQILWCVNGEWFDPHTMRNSIDT